MFILLVIGAFGVIWVGIITVMMMLLTLISGVRLLVAKKKGSDCAVHKNNFKHYGIIFLISLAAVGGLLALMALVGSQITFSM